MKNTMKNINNQKRADEGDAGQHDIVRIADHESLTDALKRGLGDLYRSVFAGAPYFEKFSAEEAEDSFRQCLDQGGIVFAAFDRATGKAVAFNASLPLETVPDLKRLFGQASWFARAAYFAEDGVDQSLRRQGVSACMKRLLLSANFSAGVQNVLLRTNANNYPQICAVTKAGGRVLSDIFQDVAGVRQSGKTTVDKRSFYMFTASDRQTAAQTRRLDRVTIARPGGNDTAIVWDDIARAEQKDVARRIQENYPGVEQVMFVEKGKDGRVRGQMAGGEFCGNATRSLGYMLLEGKPGRVTVDVSGTDRPLDVEVDAKGARTDIPVHSSLDCVHWNESARAYQVDIEGISFLVTYNTQTLGQSIQGGVEERKRAALDILRQTGLADSKPASGVIVLEEGAEWDYTPLHPYVYVRDTGTMYYETACGSGTTAAALMAASAGKAGTMTRGYEQPSGMALVVTIERSAGAFEKATVNGAVDIAFDGPMHLPARSFEFAKAAP
jgi:diaminopimelate epimerase